MLCNGFLGSCAKRPPWSSRGTTPRYVCSEDKRPWATNTHGWEGSDPKALYVWCKNEVGNPERAQLRRTVRYPRPWAVICFGADQSGRPTSVLLTVIATEAFLELDDHVPPARYRERLLAAETPV